MRQVERRGRRGKEEEDKVSERCSKLGQSGARKREREALYSGVVGGAGVEKRWKMRGGRS